MKNPEIPLISNFQVVPNFSVASETAKVFFKRCSLKVADQQNGMSPNAKYKKERKYCLKMTSKICI